jgi:hypothetical protein
MYRLIRTVVLVGLILGVATRVLNTHHASEYAPSPRTTGHRPAGATVIVVFIPVAQTAGYFHHAFILFFDPDELHTPGGAYKTEGLGGGSRNIIGVPSFIQPTAPHSATAQRELTNAANQDCAVPPYLFPPWGSCSWQDFSIIIHTHMSVGSLLNSFAQTARCFAAHPLRYDLWGPNTNTYAYTALLNAGLAHPGEAPGAVAAPGWGGDIGGPCTLHRRAPGNGG